MKFKNFPIYRIEWVTSAFLIGTALLSLTVVPWFLWTQFHLADDAANKVHGWGFIWAMFVFYYYATGFGITLGYHRLFSHISFKAKWPVKVFVLLFGAASFENSALAWCSRSSASQPEPRRRYLPTSARQFQPLNAHSRTCLGVTGVGAHLAARMPSGS